jgi:2-succinyl-6-hydroxy-2,4-cyclohexadiene-1-carboxylate synthase
MTRIPFNGIELNVEVSGGGPALLLLHGFTGDISTWEPFLDDWGAFTRIRVDLIGHGKSDAPADPERYSMEHAVEDLVALLDELDIGAAALLGYSLGGRLALHFALAQPERLWGLILESAGVGIEDPEERAARRRADEALADDMERDGIEAFVDRWQNQPLFASQTQLPADVLERQRLLRLSHSPVGLANSLRGMGAGTQQYLMPQLAESVVPSLFLAGALDERYAALAKEMARLMPGAALDIAPNAGHAVHLEEADRFRRAVTGFLYILIGEELSTRHMEEAHGDRLADLGRIHGRALRDG